MNPNSFVNPYRSTLLAWILSLTVSLFSQSATPTTTRFLKDGLAFDYPSTWNITDKSNSEAQHLVLNSPDSSAVVMVIADRDIISYPEYLDAARRDITEPIVQQIIAKLGGNSVQRQKIQIKINGLDVDGMRLRGRLNGEPTTADIYSLVEKGRFINLVSIASDKDAVADVGLATVAKNFQIDQSSRIDILNGRILKFVKPAYPFAARQARISGTVTVQVLIDEGGNVIEAKAVSGPKELYGASKDAALRTKFTPTRSYGYFIKVGGVLQYNFSQF